MSLILRTTCQDHLNNYGLGEYHVRLNSNQCLSIAAECGKPFVSINGIQFASGRPTRAEIDAAANLLEEFILTHRETIKAVITAKAVISRTPALTVKQVEILGFESDYSGSVSSSITFKDKVASWVYDLDTNKVKYSKCYKPSPLQLTNYKFDKTFVTKGKKLATQWKKNQAAQKVLTDALKTLVACDI